MTDDPTSPPESLEALVVRFDPSVFDAPRGSARIRLVVKGRGRWDAEVRGKRYRDLEGQVAGLVKLDLLDPRADHFQSSTTEALFLSNGPEIQRYLAPSGKNLVARLSAMTDTGRLIDTAVWTILSRASEAEERGYLIKWVDEHKQSRARACSELAWALLTCAEFRFNH